MTTTIALVLAGAGLGFTVRLSAFRALYRAWRRAVVKLRDSEARHDAYRYADTRADLDLVGPLTPRPRFVDFDREEPR